MKRILHFISLLGVLAVLASCSAQKAASLKTVAILGDSYSTFAGLGVEPEHVRVVVPLPKNMEEITRILKEEIDYPGVSVIIPRRECIQTAARKAREARKLRENN